MISCFAFEMLADDLRRAALEDVVLEAVELVAHLAEHRERGVDVRVDDLVEQVARALREVLLTEVLSRLESLEHRAERRQGRIGKGDQVIGPDEEVELRGEQPAGRLLEDRELEDDEDVVVVGVELRALVPRVDVLEVERVEVEVLLEPLAVGETGLFDVDPAEAAALDDLRIGGRLYVAGQDRAARDATAKARAWERQVRHRLGGFMVGVPAQS